MNIIDRISGAFRTSPPRSAAMRRILLASRLTAGVIVAPILLGFAAFMVLIHTDAGHNYLRSFLQDQAAKALGVRVRVQDFTIQLSTLSADVSGLSVDGAGIHTYPPLLEVEHAHVGVRVVSIFGGKWYFDSIRIRRPVVRIYVDKDGVSNLPIFSSNSNSKTSIFDLGIRSAVVTDGEIFYNDHPRSVALDVRNIDLDATYNGLLRKYAGKLAYSDGRVSYAGTDLPPHGLNVRFEATPGALHLESLKIGSGNTQLNLTATLNNFSAPAIQAQYNAVMDGRQMAAILHNQSVPAGLVYLAGSAVYQFDQHRPLLQSLTVEGQISSPELMVETSSGLRARISDLGAHYVLSGGDATFRDFHASLLGGQLRAHGAMTKIGEEHSHTRLEAEARGISLAESRRLVRSGGSAASVAIQGTLNANATAEWEKNLDSLVAQTDAIISAGVSNHGQVEPGPGPTSGRQTPSPGQVPVQGVLHARYTARDQVLSVTDTSIHTAQTHLDLNGTIGNHSNLAVRIQANDLHEVDEIAELLRKPAPQKPLQPLGLSGTATFTGIVNGSLSKPYLTGQFSSQDVQIEGSRWRLIRARLEASPAEIGLHDAELIPATRGRITLNATAQLHDWSLSKEGLAQVQIKASQIDVTEMARLSGTTVPITGTLGADLSLHGSLLHPEGAGNITLTKSVVYGEPITSAKVELSGSGARARANLTLVARAGSIHGIVTADSDQRTFAAELTSNGIHLDQLETLKSNNPGPVGVALISAKGHGTFDNPSVSAAIKVPKLVIRDQNISDIRLQAELADHVANAQLTSNVLNSAVKATARVTLSGNYPADAVLDTQGISLAPLFATYAPDQADKFSGETELHATMHGPLRNPKQIEAHLNVPVLKVDYSKAIQLSAAAPLRVDYKDGTINVQRSSIRGTDTDLEFQGTIPASGNAPMSLLLLGSVDLHIAQLFDPDLRTSGQIKFNVNSYGAEHGPGVEGTVDVVDAALASPDMPAGLTHCNGRLTLSNDRINVSQLKGSIGGGTITAQGGVVLRPSAQFDLGIAARDVRMLYPQGMRESINANLRFTGSPKSALLGGNLNLTDLSFTRGFDLNDFIGQFTGGVESPPSQGFTQNIALNVAVHSTNSVNLVSRTLSVGGSANLQLRGTASEPVILGRVNLTGGDIVLNGSRYVLTGGTIQFVNPSMTQPVVNLSVSTTIQQYDINLRFEGPVDQLRTQYTSDPALPQADIIHLLALGTTTEGNTNPGKATPVSQQAEALVASQVSSQVTSRLSKVAGISQLSIDPALGSSNSSGATVTVKQRVTGRLFVTFQQDLSSQQGPTLQGEYELSPRTSVSATRNANGGFGAQILIKRSW